MNESEACAYWASLDHETALALAKTAPKVAGAWERIGGGMWSRLEYGSDAEDAAVVTQPGDGQWSASCGDSWLYRDWKFPTADTAKAACDAELRRLGFILLNHEVTA